MRPGRQRPRAGRQAFQGRSSRRASSFSPFAGDPTPLPEPLPALGPFVLSDWGLHSGGLRPLPGCSRAVGTVARSAQLTRHELSCAPSAQSHFVSNQPPASLSQPFSSVNAGFRISIQKLKASNQLVPRRLEGTACGFVFPPSLRQNPFISLVNLFVWTLPYP